MNNPFEHLDSSQPADVSALRELCDDPRDMFVFCPQPLRIVDIVKLYANDPSEVPRLMSELRQRSASERWVELRAIHQSKRFAVRQEAIVQAEAFVIASLACDMHVQTLRSRIERWGLLSAYVEDGLARCASAERPFSQDLRDACRALDDLETTILEALPAMGTTEAASRHLTGSRTKRDELIVEVESKLKSMAGADRGGAVLRLVRSAD